jgi:predicted RNA-binding protein with PIN domain
MVDPDPGEETGGEHGPERRTALPEPVRARVVGWASDTLGALEGDQVPPSLSRVAAFAPARRARVAGGQIAGALAHDAAFRARVAATVHREVPALAEAVAHGRSVEAADPVDVAAVAYLLRPRGWSAVVDAAAEAALEEPSRGGRGGGPTEQAHLRIEALTAEVARLRQRHREQVGQLKAEVSDLRHRLGDARGRARTAEQEVARLGEVGRAAEASAAAEASERAAEIRRLRRRVEQLEADLLVARRADRVDRAGEALRARLLLDTLLDSAQGLRRELNLPAAEGAPADAVAADLAESAEHGTRTTSVSGALPKDDPALLEHMLAMPRVHLLVDGYNVTKNAWPELSLERQRDRLLGGMAPLAARTGAEVTVVFDAGATTERPVVHKPRGVRVLFSAPGVIADDVIRGLVALEPRGRPVVVVSSDQAVVRDVARAGARTVAAPALSRLLTRS